MSEQARKKSAHVRNADLPVTPVGIYIHIPFCLKKCGYCHFLSFPFDMKIGRRYMDALMMELRFFADGYQNGLGEKPTIVDSIYFGGGTPSLIPAEWITEILDECRRLFPLADDCEISMEANPGTLSPDKATTYRAAGVNRISLGAQSFNDAELMTVGRIHDAAAIADSLTVLAVAGFENTSLDLMIGLPEQTAPSWRETLHAATGFPIRHISVYMLDLEESSPLRAHGSEKTLVLPDEELVADLYLETIAYLNSHGLAQYEISNFAWPEHAARHNLKYWQRVPVYGFGLGSHSFDGHCRYADASEFDEYFRQIESGNRPVAWHTEITEKQASEERIFLGLRLTEGIDLRKTSNMGKTLLKEHRSTLEEFCSADLLEWNETSLRLTTKGMLISNEIMRLFV